MSKDDEVGGKEECLRTTGSGYTQNERRRARQATQAEIAPPLVDKELSCTNDIVGELILARFLPHCLPKSAAGMNHVPTRAQEYARRQGGFPTDGSSPTISPTVGAPSAGCSLTSACGMADMRILGTGELTRRWIWDTIKLVITLYPAKVK